MGMIANQSKGGKPSKPYPGFPLFAHANGQWAKKIAGRTHYFGTWSDPDTAHELFKSSYDALLRGEEPEVGGGSLTLGELAAEFLTLKKARVKSGELAQRTLDDYRVVIDEVVEVLGPRRLVSSLAPRDFERLRQSFAARHGPVRLGNDIQRARSLFKFARDQYQVEVHYGVSFQKPSRATLRKVRRNRMLDPLTINAALAVSSPTLRAMILLGINCGFGNADCSALEWRYVDLDRGWHHFPRTKTGKDRRCPLWQETVQALKSLPQDRDLVFLTNKGNSWARRHSHDPVSHEFGKLLRVAGRHRPGLGFYSLRHTFQTVGNRSGLSHATSYIMGHVPAANDMPAVYQQVTWDDQLRTVVSHVRDWLLDMQTLGQSGEPVFGDDVGPPSS